MFEDPENSKHRNLGVVFLEKSIKGRRNGKKNLKYRCDSKMASGNTKILINLSRYSFGQLVVLAS